MTPPLVVAGMHRSGTSMIASILSAAGVAMGDALLEADRANPLGYFEDTAFLSLHQRMLTEATSEDDGGHRDWGWTEGEGLDRECFERYRDEGRTLVAAQLAADRPWGWKDPRTTLSLDFWNDLVPDARYVFVYRYPWDVADSMQRLGAEVFLRHPEYAHRIWSFYNRHLLDFHRRHPDRSLLISANAVMRRPALARILIAERLGLDVPAARFDEMLQTDLLRTVDGPDPLIRLVAATSPESVRRLAELDAAAALPSSGLWDVSGGHRPRAVGGLHGAPPRLSVVIPCRDHGELLVDAVASVERSIPEPTELIVVDDGSRQPRTLDVLRALDEAGYVVVRQENLGLAAARNRGIDLATGPYVVPLDADNRLLPGFWGAAMDVLDADPSVGVVYGDRLEFGLRSGAVTVAGFDLDTILTGNYIDACTLIRKRAWADTGGFDSHMPHQGWEDWDFWLSAVEAGWRLHHVPENSFEYRVRPGSMSSGLATSDTGKPLQDYIVGKHRDLYLRRLPDLLVVLQSMRRASESMRSEARSMQRETEAMRSDTRSMQQETASMRRELATRLDEAVGLRREVDVCQHLVQELHGSVTALKNERHDLLAAQTRLTAERSQLDEERTQLKERLAMMERTRAHRLQQTLWRLKAVLRRARP